MNEAEKIFREVKGKRMAFLYRQEVNRRTKNDVITFRRKEEAGGILRKAKEKTLLIGIRSGKEYNKKTITALANLKLMQIRENIKNQENRNNRKDRDDER